MAIVDVKCIECHSNKVKEYGLTKQGKQRYACENNNCDRKTFILDYTYNGCKPETKKKIVDMTLNASGIRDTARVLEISPTTVIETIKSKSDDIVMVNRPLLEKIETKDVTVDIEKVVDEAEMDEMWSFVDNKGQQRWLWHAIDHQTGDVLAYKLGSHEDEVFLELKELLCIYYFKTPPHFT